MRQTSYPTSPRSPSWAAARPSAPTRATRPRAEVAILWLEGLLALGAFIGAFGFIIGGVHLGAATSSLPFGSITFAGLSLAAVNGVLPTIVLIGALRRRPWASVGHLVVGLTLVAWIVTQVVILGPPIVILQAVFFAWGWAIAALAARLLQKGH
jgi:hypothetical protein